MTRVPLISAQLLALRRALHRPVGWTIGGHDHSIDHVILHLRAADGRTGAAEVICKPQWNAMTASLLMEAFETLAWPGLHGADTSDPEAGLHAVAQVRGAVALHALVDNAWHDLAAPRPGAIDVAACAVLTRAAPQDMGAQAARLCTEAGIGAFKVKAGQGLATDAQAIAAVRRAIGPEAELGVDANSAYDAARALELCRIAAHEGVAFVEDPCALWPDAQMAAFCARADTPIAVDRGLSAPGLAQAYLDRGAALLAAKPTRLGVSAARKIRECARDNTRGCVSALLGEAVPGAVTIAREAHGAGDTPVEVLFHRELVALPGEPQLSLSAGHLSIPAGRLAELVDFEALAPQAQAVRHLHTDAEVTSAP